MILLLLLSVLTTTYTNKTYSTVCAVEVNAPAEIADTIIAHFIYDFQTNPDVLFDWAFYGVGTQEDGEKNAFLLEYKKTQYIPDNNYGSVLVDVVIPGFTRIKNIKIEGKVIDEHRPIKFNNTLMVSSLTMKNIPDWSRHIDINVEYSGRLLEKGNGNLYIIPVDETHSVFLMDINLKYGWFFNLFITMKVYENSVEWRVKKYMNNLKFVAENWYE